jgi:hypothetical protein
MFDTIRTHYRNAQRVAGRVKLDDVRRRELAEAQLQKQENESRRDYYAAMVSYDAKRIECLEAQLGQSETVQAIGKAREVSRLDYEVAKLGASDYRGNA